MLAGREDLTHIPLPTIDPDDARDHDDAVWVARTDSGGYEVWVAIADVSSYVRPGTKLDDEARARGCSIYLPDRAIPMLPRALSSNLCSLLPDVTRLCLAVHAELDARGNITKSLNGAFRVHLPPDPQKLERLAAMCEVLGIELDVEDTQTPKGLADVLKSFSEHPLAGVLNQLLLRSMKQATYDVQNLGHFGL